MASRRAFLGGGSALVAASLLSSRGDSMELIDDLQSWLAGRELRLILNFGQSNADGNIVPQGEGLVEHPRVLAFYAGGDVGSRPTLWPVAPVPPSLRYARRWATAREPLGWSADRMGPGFVAAKALADAWGEGVVVGIVPCAQGGKLLSYFDLTTLQYGLSMLAARNVGAVWDCCLFFHGESNASAGWTQQEYSDACDAWLAQYRGALGAPQLRVICAELAQTANYAGKAAINAALADWPGRDPHVRHISSLGAASSGAHYTYDGYVEMGARAAAARLGMP